MLSELADILTGETFIWCICSYAYIASWSKWPLLIVRPRLFISKITTAGTVLYYRGVIVFVLQVTSIILDYFLTLSMRFHRRRNKSNKSE